MMPERADEPPFISDEVAAGLGAVLDVYNAALEVVSTWMDMPHELGTAHDRAVYELSAALVRVGVLEA